MANREIIGPREATDILGVPGSWIYQLKHAGRLPFPYHKVGMYLRFKRSDVEKYLESTRVDQTTDRAVNG